FHGDEGGEGERRGGKGVVLDYRITAEEAFLTYSATRTTSRPWGAAGGREGSNNAAALIRKDGSIERFSMVTAVRAESGETFRLITATGGGYGDPRKRDRAQVLADLKNGYVTAEQARTRYGVEPPA
ncbi:MAG: hydantoinase B/oxoprolinase family protein, partial [Caulobacteraceae bacterium]|nr:hydantoinase B/oxoprolinase family protein [Caulobacteraceae bacterium]